MANGYPRYYWPLTVIAAEAVTRILSGASNGATTTVPDDALEVIESAARTQPMAGESAEAWKSHVAALLLAARGEASRDAWLAVAAAYEKIDRTHHYEPAEAVALLKQTATARFDETVEVHIRLGVNVRHAEEQLRGTLALPNGAARDVTVAVFAEGDKAREATEAGAEFVGSDDLAERVEAGWTDFDIVIATPDQMPKVGRLGRILGPQGKMPNPKVGTVTDDVTKAVSETKSGKIEYRTDRQAVVHLSIGKASFSEQALLENYAAVVDEIVRAKPAAAKGRYIISITLTTTMGPGIRVDSGRTGEAEILGAGAEDEQSTEPAVA